MGVFSGRPRRKHLTKEMSNKPTKQQVRKAFYRADKNGDGQLSPKEFKAVMLALMDDPAERRNFSKALDKDKEMLDFILSSLDTDGNKMVSLEELMVIIDCDKEGSEKQTWINMVKAADKNKDGFISAKEMRELGKMFGDDTFKDDKDFKMLVMMADLNGDRKLSVDELARFFTWGQKKEEPKDEMKNLFRMCDVDRNGYLDLDEVVKLLKLLELVRSDETDRMMMMPQITKMMAAADTNKDGKLNYKEFCRVLNSMK